MWYPHARFHGALLLFLLAGVAATGVWGLWRRTEERVAAVRTAAGISLSFWTPLFYITSELPGSMLWAGMPRADPRLTGSLVTPNLIVAAVFVAVTVSATVLAGRLKAPWAPNAALCAE